MADEQMIAVDGVDLCVQTFGVDRDPALLLIAGMSSSMDWWQDEWCERLAATGRRVIRYDHRDTGRSASWPAGVPDYTFTDLIDDAVGVLDALAIDQAHVVGLSMGGGIAQALAIDHPDRVATLTLMSTALIASVGRELPGMTDELVAYESTPRPEPDWGDRSAVIAHLLSDLRAYAGSWPFAEEEVAQLVGRIVDRTTDMRASETNHAALLSAEDSTRDDPAPSLTRIRTPTLVLHGTEDPLFPFPHAEALAGAITGAQLVALPRVGHEYPPRPVWDLVISSIAVHTQPRERA